MTSRWEGIALDDYPGRARCPLLREHAARTAGLPGNGAAPVPAGPGAQPHGNRQRIVLRRATGRDSRVGRYRVGAHVDGEYRDRPHRVAAARNLEEDPLDRRDGRDTTGERAREV